MIVHLKRFDNLRRKIKKHIDFSDTLDLTNFVCNKAEKQQKYNLISVLIHEGTSTNSGHYYCYIKNTNNMWYCMNDCNVYNVSLEHVLKQNPYLLFYEKDSSSETNKCLNDYMENDKMYIGKLQAIEGKSKETSKMGMGQMRIDNQNKENEKLIKSGFINGNENRMNTMNYMNTMNTMNLQSSLNRNSRSNSPNKKKHEILSEKLTFNSANSIKTSSSINYMNNNISNMNTRIGSKLKTELIFDDPLNSLVKMTKSNSKKSSSKAKVNFINKKTKLLKKSKKSKK